MSSGDKVAPLPPPQRTTALQVLSLCFPKSLPSTWTVLASHGPSADRQEGQGSGGHGEGVNAKKVAHSLSSETLFSPQFKLILRTETKETQARRLFR